MNTLIVEKDNEKYAISCKDYFTCQQFDGTELKENGEAYQVLNKEEIKVIGEIDENGEEIIY